jgi:hypothetical protein
MLGRQRTPAWHMSRLTNTQPMLQAGTSSAPVLHDLLLGIDFGKRQSYDRRRGPPDSHGTAHFTRWRHSKDVEYLEPHARPPDRCMVHSQALLETLQRITHANLFSEVSN